MAGSPIARDGSGSPRRSDDTARLYRKALWPAADAYVEVWLEKDALAGVVSPITSQFSVPLMGARGYFSLRLLPAPPNTSRASTCRPIFTTAATTIPAGMMQPERSRRPRRMAPQAEIHFERLAVTPTQMRNWRPPCRPTKKSDSRAKGFRAVSVGLDAIPPGQLCALVQSAIERHLPPEQ
jgi:hypothetical protein